MAHQQQLWRLEAHGQGGRIPCLRGLLPGPQMGLLCPHMGEGRSYLGPFYEDPNPTVSKELSSPRHLPGPTLGIRFQREFWGDADLGPPAVGVREAGGSLVPAPAPGAGTKLHPLQRKLVFGPTRTQPCVSSCCGNAQDERARSPVQNTGWAGRGAHPWSSSLGGADTRLDNTTRPHPHNKQDRSVAD